MMIDNSLPRWERFSNLHHRRYRNRFKVHYRPSHFQSAPTTCKTLAGGKAYGLYLLGTVHARFFRAKALYYQVVGCPSVVEQGLTG